MFFKPFPSVQYIHNHKAHVFECVATPCHCQSCFIHQFLDTSNARSTSNLRHHAKMCWSDEAVQAADGTWNVTSARVAIQSLDSVNGSITAAFQWVGKGKVVYSHRQHTKTEARYVVSFYPSGRHLKKIWVVPSLSTGSQRIIDPSE